MARINNSAGTAAGDSVLDEIGRRLENFASDELGQGSCVDRLDGPRFLIVPATPLSLGALARVLGDVAKDRFANGRRRRYLVDGPRNGGGDHGSRLARDSRVGARGPDLASSGQIGRA